tara:strand:+ start:311 stop:709 length:399 start_codon:yes stop_codon:yes gene_type:complete
MSKLQDEYMDKLNLKVLKLEIENTELKKELRDLVERVPSVYLTDNSAKFSGETHPDAKHKSWDEIMPHKEWVDSWVKHNNENGEDNQKYIYERNPDTGQVYRRKYNDYDTPREPVDSQGNPLSKQMELFEDK